MIQNEIRDKYSWLATPSPGHLVQFYQSSSDLLVQLTEFISKGLTVRDNCLVIGTPLHIKALGSSLEALGIDVEALQYAGHYLALDASELLAQFMVRGLPDHDRFFDVVAPLVEKFVQKGKPIRAYGEMVALLWKVGNKNAVMQLENLWNKLAKQHSFSLFCAYPKLHFVMDHEMREKIGQCHNVSLSTPLTV